MSFYDLWSAVMIAAIAGFILVFTCVRQVMYVTLMFTEMALVSWSLYGKKI